MTLDLPPEQEVFDCGVAHVYDVEKQTTSNESDVDVPKGVPLKRIADVVRKQKPKVAQDRHQKFIGHL